MQGHIDAGKGSVVQMLQHAAHAADLEHADNKSLFLFQLDSPIRIGPFSPGTQTQEHPATLFLYELGS